MKDASGQERASVEEMRRFIARKARRRKEKNAALWRKARQDAAEIVAMIAERFAPRAIYQWGSVLDGSTFSDISDIDIAVEGIPSQELFFDLVGKAEAMTEFPLDIVEIERVEPEYARLIRTNGKRVYAGNAGKDAP